MNSRLSKKISNYFLVYKMEIKVLDSIADKEKWLEIIQSEKNFFDIFYHPEYINLFLANNKHSNGNLFYIKADNKIWINIQVHDYTHDNIYSTNDLCFFYS